jgi:hypothetical protein
MGKIIILKEICLVQLKHMGVADFIFQLKYFQFFTDILISCFCNTSHLQEMSILLIE